METRRSDTPPTRRLSATAQRDTSPSSLTLYTQSATSYPSTTHTSESISVSSIQTFSDELPWVPVEHSNYFYNSGEQQSLNSPPNRSAKDTANDFGIQALDAGESSHIAERRRRAHGITPASIGEDNDDSDYKPSPRSAVYKRRQSLLDPISRAPKKPSIKRKDNTHKPKKSHWLRPFPCPLAIYGCGSTFTSIRKWKRHVSTQHVKLGFWRCDLCPPSMNPANSVYNDFNRMDLFTHHIRRIHAEDVMRRYPNIFKHRFDAGREIMPLSYASIPDHVMAEEKNRCYHRLRSPPLRSGCLFCSQVFEGIGSWEQRMEHLGAHFEREKKDPKVTLDTSHWREDHELREWFLQEGLIEPDNKGGWRIGDGQPRRHDTLFGEFEASPPRGSHNVPSASTRLGLSRPKQQTQSTASRLKQPTPAILSRLQQEPRDTDLLLTTSRNAATSLTDRGSTLGRSKNDDRVVHSSNSSAKDGGSDISDIFSWAEPSEFESEESMQSATLKAVRPIMARKFLKLAISQFAGRPNSNSKSGSNRNTNRNQNSQIAVPNDGLLRSTSSKRKRPDVPSDDDDEEQTSQQRTTASQDSMDERLFACPYCKNNPLRYRRCYKYTLRDISRVKQHLARCHRIPIHCPSCSKIFEKEKDCNEHIRARSCHILSPKRWEGIDEDQRKQLEQRISSKKCKEENWYIIYDIIFPGAPRPRSPYLHYKFSEELLSLQDFAASRGLELIRTHIRNEITAGTLSEDLQPHEEEIAVFAESIFRDGVDILLEQWASSNDRNSTEPLRPSESISAGSEVDHENGSDEIDRRRPSEPLATETSQWWFSSPPGFAGPHAIAAAANLETSSVQEPNLFHELLNFEGHLAEFDFG